MLMGACFTRKAFVQADFRKLQRAAMAVKSHPAIIVVPPMGAAKENSFAPVSARIDKSLQKTMVPTINSVPARSINLVFAAARAKPAMATPAVA